MVHGDIRAGGGHHMRVLILVQTIILSSIGISPFPVFTFFARSIVLWTCPARLERVIAVFTTQEPARVKDHKGDGSDDIEEKRVFGVTGGVKRSQDRESKSKVIGLGGQDRW